MFTNSTFVQDFQQTYLYKATKSFVALTGIILAVSAVAALIFLISPFMMTFSLGALTLAKWTACVALCTAVGGVTFVLGKKALSIIQNKLHGTAY